MNKLSQKKLLERTLAVIALSGVTLVVFAPAVLAQDSFQINNPLTATTVEDLIDKVVNYLFYLGVAIAPVLILLGAFYFLTSGGNPERVEKGKKIILYTLLGVTILYMSNILLNLIRTVLGFEG